MEKIISELIKAIEIIDCQIEFGQASVSSCFEIIVTYDLYKLLMLNNKLFLYNPPFHEFMGHKIRVTTDLDGFSFWIADRQDIKNESSN